MNVTEFPNNERIAGIDCDDNDSTLVQWNNSTGSPLLVSSDKYWIYDYLNAPNIGGYVDHDGSYGVMNDGVESYSGDSLSDPDGNGSWYLYVQYRYL
jgi:hypothetical protein